MAKIAKKLEDYYTVNPVSGCWESTKALTTFGTARMQIKNKVYVASRYFYEIYVGKIPPGLQLDHLCRNRACMNPKHVEPVTCAENIRRESLSKITMAKAEEIRKLYAENRLSQSVLAKKFGIGQDEVSRIVNNRRWAQ